MQYILALDIGEDRPALFGPYAQATAERQGAEMHKRWGSEYEIWPVYSSYGEYLRETGDISD